MTSSGPVSGPVDPKGYASMANYMTTGFHFEVSKPRAVALNQEVSLCTKPMDFEDPWVLGPTQCQRCKSYLNRGGYDANKWKR